MKKNLLFAILATLLFTNCSTKGTNISGTIKNAQNLEGMFEEVMMSQVLAISKVNLDAAGNFKINVPEGAKAGIYRLRIGQKQMNLIFNGKEKNVKIESDLADIKECTNGTQTLTVTTTGGVGELSYQWQKSADGLEHFLGRLVVVGLQIGFVHRRGRARRYSRHSMDEGVAVRSAQPLVVGGQVGQHALGVGAAIDCCKNLHAGAPVDTGTRRGA